MRHDFKSVVSRLVSVLTRGLNLFDKDDYELYFNNNGNELIVYMKELSDVKTAIVKITVSDEGFTVQTNYFSNPPVSYGWSRERDLLRYIFRLAGHWRSGLRPHFVHH
ncbi:MAG: hypothetical protein WC519_01640 [Parcubacteria group bacterium]